MAALSVVWCLLQLVLVALLRRFDPVGWMQANGLPVPDSVQWASANALALTLLLLLLSLAFLAVSWALLQHREWGRVGFIVFLLVVALANFAMLPLVDGLFDAVQSLFPADLMASREGRDALMQLQASRWFSLLSTGTFALVFAVLHGWLAFKLQRADVRALFH